MSRVKKGDFVTHRFRAGKFEVLDTFDKTALIEADGSEILAIFGDLSPVIKTGMNETVPAAYTINQAASMLGCSRSTVARAIRSRQIASFKFRGRRLISAASIGEILSGEIERDPNPNNCCSYKLYTSDGILEESFDTWRDLQKSGFLDRTDTSYVRKISHKCHPTKMEKKQS